MNEVLITFPDEHSMIAFCKWFDKIGFDSFMGSEFEHGVSCLATSEYPKEVGTDFYTDISPQCQFELE